MIEKPHGPTSLRLSLRQAMTPTSSKSQTGATHHSVAFAQTLKHPMETRGGTTESDTDAAERAHRSQAPPEGPTEIRAQRQAPAGRREAPMPHPPQRPTDAGLAPQPALQGATRPDDTIAQSLRALGKAALQATPDVDVAALSRAVRQAAGRLTDTSAAARDAASTARMAVTDAALRPSLARPGGAPTLPTQHSAERFEALLQQFSARSGDATTFRLIDGTAGTLEIKVALSGQDLYVNVRAEDAAMNAALSASLEDLRKQLQAANIVPATGDVHVSQEPTHHDDDEHYRRSQDPDPGEHDSAQSRPERGDG